LNAFWPVFIILVAAAVIIDARTYRIPNWLTGAIAGLGLVFVIVTAPQTLLVNLAVAAATLAIGFGLYRFASFGAGDAKLFAAVMIWFGAAGVVPLLFWFGVACGVLVVLLLIGRRINFPEGSGLANWRPFQKGAPVPLALAIGPAAIAASVLILRA